MNTKRYFSRKTFQVGDTLLWRGLRWKVLFEYPPANWFDQTTAYCVEVVR